MAEVKSLVCDVCGGPDASGYTISRRPGAPWIIDLCEGCATPLSEMQSKGRPPAGKKRPYRKYGKKVDVVTDTPRKP